MIFRHTNLDAEFNFGYFGKIIIENPKFYREFISDLSFNSDGYSFSFSSDGKILDSSQYDFIANPCSLDLNNKKITTSLIKKISLGAVSENFYLEINQNSANLQKLFMRIIDEEQFPFDILLDEPTPEGLIKTFNPKIDQSNIDFVENLYKYLEVMSELADIRLFVFLGLSTFLNDEEIRSIVDFCMHNELTALTVENFDKFNKDLVCPKIIIDEDLCVI